MQSSRKFLRCTSVFHLFSTCLFHLSHFCVLSTTCWSLLERGEGGGNSACHGSSQHSCLNIRTLSLSTVPRLGTCLHCLAWFPQLRRKQFNLKVISRSMFTTQKSTLHNVWATVGRWLQLGFLFFLSLLLSAACVSQSGHILCDRLPTRFPDKYIPVDEQRHGPQCCGDVELPNFTSQCGTMRGIHVEGELLSIVGRTGKVPPI
ncbi:hypothetical protein BKA64DRAFT_169310 [Cadophora sp. MPI-SDFR-AT-0126]|nr:hypothetical protein BKA64DRAFT_169310 [Leotiomycetes sp. MPI-SDFR-AT-0126]